MSTPYQFAAKPSYRLLQLTDCHLLAEPEGEYQQIKPYQHLAALLSSLKSRTFDALILTGDLTQDHSLASYQLLADLLKDWPSPVFYLPGNHDEPALMAEAFAKPPFVAATELRANGWTWLLLNTKGATPAGEFDQSRLLELATSLQNSNTPVWIFCHHHPMPIGSAIDRHGLQQPEALLSLLAAHHQVKGLAHGHCHYAYQAKYQGDHPAGLTIVGCPATSVQFTLSPEWQTEDLGPQGCVWTFAADGEVTWGVYPALTAKLVVYLHGFASSSQSEKALLTAAYFQQHLPQHQLLLPDLPYTPFEAVAAIDEALQGRIPDAVIGSSLGGFLATRLAEKFHCKAVLINPAVQPHLLLQQHLGRYFHPVLQQDYQVSAEHLPILAQLAPAKPTAESQITVLLQTGDEVLDYREALDFYQHCQLDVQEGGDHSYQGYANRLPDIVKFCQLA